jgi:hypothetical protein
MPAIGTSGSMSGDGKRGVAERLKLPRPSSTLPSVWTGRALQAENDDLEKCWSCASVSGLLMERSAPGHHGYPRALDLIRVSAPKAIWAT